MKLTCQPSVKVQGDALSAVEVYKAQGERREEQSIINFSNFLLLTFNCNACEFHTTLNQKIIHV